LRELNIEIDNKKISWEEAKENEKKVVAELNKRKGLWSHEKQAWIQNLWEYYSKIPDFRVKSADPSKMFSYSIFSFQDFEKIYENALITWERHEEKRKLRLFLKTQPELEQKKQIITLPGETGLKIRMIEEKIEEERYDLKLQKADAITLHGFIDYLPAEKKEEQRKFENTLKKIEKEEAKLDEKENQLEVIKNKLRFTEEDNSKVLVALQEQNNPFTLNLEKETSKAVRNSRERSKKERNDFSMLTQFMFYYFEPDRPQTEELIYDADIYNKDYIHECINLLNKFGKLKTLEINHLNRLLEKVFNIEGKVIPIIKSNAPMTPVVANTKSRLESTPAPEFPPISPDSIKTLSIGEPSASEPSS